MRHESNKEMYKKMDAKIISKKKRIAIFLILALLLIILLIIILKNYDGNILKQYDHNSGENEYDFVINGIGNIKKSLTQHGPLIVDGEIITETYLDVTSNDYKYPGVIVTNNGNLTISNSIINKNSSKTTDKNITAEITKNSEPEAKIDPEKDFDTKFKPNPDRKPDPSLAPDSDGPDGTPGGAPPSDEFIGGARGGVPGNQEGRENPGALNPGGAGGGGALKLAKEGQEDPGEIEPGGENGGGPKSDQDGREDPGYIQPGGPIIRDPYLGEGDPPDAIDPSITPESGLLVERPIAGEPNENPGEIEPGGPVGAPVERLGEIWDDEETLVSSQVIGEVTSDVTIKSSETGGGNIGSRTSGVFVGSKGIANISNGIVNTNLQEGKGVCVVGKGASVGLENIAIITNGNSSHGVFVTGGGAAQLADVTVTTKGEHSSVLATDTGGGKIIAKGGTFAASGELSAGIYSTGDIRVSDAVFKSELDNAAVMEYGSKISLVNTSLWAGKKAAVMIYQSFANDGGLSEFKMTGGNITAEDGPIFYVTNTTATIEIKKVDMVNKTDIFLMVLKGGWGADISGAKPSRGGSVFFYADEQTMAGDMLIDENSSVNIRLKNNTLFKGAINPDNTAKEINLTIDAKSTWEVTGDSYIDKLIVSDVSGDSVSNIIGNGYTVYYDKDISSDLRGGIYKLNKNGIMKPKISKKKTIQALNDERRKIYTDNGATLEIEQIYGEMETAGATDVKNENGDVSIIRNKYKSLIKKMRLSNSEEDKFIIFLEENNAALREIINDRSVMNLTDEEYLMMEEEQIEKALEYEKEAIELLGEVNYKKYCEYISTLGLFSENPVDRFEMTLDNNEKLDELQKEQLYEAMAEEFEEFLLYSVPWVKGTPGFRVGLKDEDVKSIFAEDIQELQDRYLMCAKSILSEQQIEKYEKSIKKQVTDTRLYYQKNQQ